MILFVICLILFIILLSVKYKVLELFTNSIPIYVIHMNKSKDREQRMNTQFRHLNLKFNYFKAVDGSNMNKEQQFLYNKYIIQNTLNTGQVGIFLSSILLYQHIINQK